MARRRWDQYYTPASATHELVGHINLHGDNVLEPCNGTGAISEVLTPLIGTRVETNDLDPSLPADHHRDATLIESWASFKNRDWVISNPPFSEAAKIIPLAYVHARRGIAMLLRLSYLEPCLDRVLWLQERPPNKLVVLPRISFTGNGKTDNVTCAWMIWEKSFHASTYIRVVPR